MFDVTVRLKFYSLCIVYLLLLQFVQIMFYILHFISRPHFRKDFYFIIIFPASC